MFIHFALIAQMHNGWYVERNATFFNVLLSLR